MALSLSVPVSTRSLPKEIETNPKKARIWVESLPLTKTIESANSMIYMLESINRSKFAAEERIELVEIYRPVITVLMDELEAAGRIFSEIILENQFRLGSAIALLITIEADFDRGSKILRELARGAVAQGRAHGPKVVGLGLGGSGPKDK